MSKPWLGRTIPLASLLVTAGCAHLLRPDPSPAATESHYPTAEFRADGATHVGLGVVVLREGSPYSDLGFAVQGYLEGTIRVDSARCHLGATYEYAASALMPITIAGKARESCVVDISVFPRWPKERESALHVSDFKGQLLIKVVPLEGRWYGVAEKVRAGTDAELRIPSLAEAPSRVFVRGCSTMFDESRPAAGGVLSLQLSELVKEIGTQACSFEGASKQDGQVERLSWLVWGYDKGFAPLPEPVLEVVKDELRVASDKAVSIIMMDDQYVVDYKAEFPFTKDADHTLRLLTVKGRSVVCSWTKEGQAWSCLN